MHFFAMSHNDQVATNGCDEMKSILKFAKPKRLMGLKVHKDGFKANRVVKCKSLHEIEFDVNLVI